MGEGGGEGGLKAHLEVIIAAVLSDNHSLVNLGAGRKEQHAAVLQRLQRVRHAASLA